MHADTGVSPTGCLDREGAARLCGVSFHTWKRWTKEGRIAFGQWMPSPDGGRRRAYAVEDVQRFLAEMRAAGEIYAGSQGPGDAAAFPPAERCLQGWLGRDETAKFFGISPNTLALWHTNGRLRCGKYVMGPNGKKRKVYPIAELERLRAALTERPVVPEGFVDIDGAIAMFGVTRAAWIIWKRQGKVPRGQWAPGVWKGAVRQKIRRIYAVEELLRVKEEMRGADKVYREGGSSAQYHIPEGWMRLQDVGPLFGVNERTVIRWEEEGIITCGKRFLGRGLKLYPTEEMKRLAAECGRYEPPYPDPDRPGVYRIPLAGQDIRRREAIIDAADVPLVEGKRFHFSGRGEDHHAAVATFNPGGPGRLRQIIMGVEGSECVIGHRNGDPLDCRRENLVVRTRSESGAAMRKARTFCGRPCTSRFKGVCWAEQKGKWKVYIKKDQVMQNLGYYDDEIAAAERYDEAARELFGEHARLNFPEGVDCWLEREAA